MQPAVNVDRAGPVAEITLNRPHAMNALDPTLLDGLEASIDQLEVDERVKVLLIAGAGERAFCAGADIKYMRSVEGAQLRRYIERAWRVLDRIANSPLPSIAALHGYVLGGGLELALACDLRIADGTCTFGLPELVLGSVPAFGAMQRLPALVGPALAAEIVMTGRRFGAAEALEMRLVNRSVPAGQAILQAREMAGMIGARPREALGYAKAALRAGHGHQLAPVLHGLISEACHQAPGYAENTQRFAGR